MSNGTRKETFVKKKICILKKHQSNHYGKHNFFAILLSWYSIISSLSFERRHQNLSAFCISKSLSQFFLKIQYLRTTNSGTVSSFYIVMRKMTENLNTFFCLLSAAASCVDILSCIFLQWAMTASRMDRGLVQTGFFSLSPAPAS